MTNERRTLLDQLIYELKGTADDIDSVAWDLGLGELSTEDYTYVEGEIFQCSCGWWCELCEAHELYDGSIVCDDCAEEHPYE